MAVWFCMLSAVMGAAAAAFTIGAVMLAKARENAYLSDAIESKENTRTRTQYENFMNYTGGKEGQKEIES